MRRGNEGQHDGVAVLAGLVAFGLVLGAVGVSGLAGPRAGPTRLNASDLGSTGFQSTPQNCSGTGLADLTATPAKVAATPLEVLLFTAVAETACGASPTPATSFSWWLSSVSLGTLNSSAGRTVAYTACIAPMGGVLHLKATSGAVTLYANSSISVSAQSSSGSSPPSSPSGFPGGVGASNGSSISWVGVGIIAALLAAAGAVLFAGRRKRK
jgi:hypothetical protein